MELALPAAVFAAAVTLTYIFCVRPMRRGDVRCLLGPRTRGSASGTAATADGEERRTDRKAGEIDTLRQEVEALKRQLGLLPQHQASESQTSGQ